jgi:Leu/Phe-tRNA-protein transferase
MERFHAAERYRVARNAQVEEETRFCRGANRRTTRWSGVALMTRYLALLRVGEHWDKDATFGCLLWRIAMGWAFMSGA